MSCDTASGAAYNRSATKPRLKAMYRHYISPRPYLVSNIIPWGLNSGRLSATHCALLSIPIALRDSVTFLRGSCTTALGTRMAPSMTLLVVGGSAGVCSRFGFPLACSVQGGLLGRQHEGSAAGDGGIDEVQQGVGLITPPEGQVGRHMCTEGQQPAVVGGCQDMRIG